MAEPLEPVGIPMFGLTSDPMPIPPEMLTMLGEIVVLWSRIESSIDQDTTDMMHWPIVAELVKKFRSDGKRPTAFSKKLVLWRRCVRTLYPKIGAYQGTASEFECAAKLVSALRNHIIHGSWSLKPTENGGFDVWSMRPIMHTAHMQKIEVTPKLLTALLNDMRNLDNFIISFIASKMFHAHIGLLKVDHGSSPEDQDHPNPPNDSGQQTPPESSPQ